MKKLLALILMLCMLLPQAALAADAPDLSGYSNQELLELLSLVQTEIVARGIEKTARLNAGRYVGGLDIPAGTYILETAGAEEDTGLVYLAAKDDPLDGTPSKYYDYLGRGDKLHVYLNIEEGDRLGLPFPHTLTVTAGVVFQ